MVVAGHQMEAKAKSIGAMHHSKQTSKGLMLAAVKFKAHISNIVLPINTGGIAKSFGNWTLSKKDNMKM